MKVKDLQNKLAKINPELDLLCYKEDEVLQTHKTITRIFDIESLDIVDAEKKRNDNGEPTLKFGKSEYSQKIVLLDITTDF